MSRFSGPAQFCLTSLHCSKYFLRDCDTLPRQSWSNAFTRELFYHGDTMPNVKKCFGIYFMIVKY